MTPDAVYKSKEWVRLRKLVLARAGYKCQVRGVSCEHKATQVDHIVPFSRGGDAFAESNLRASCRRCNLGRRSRNVSLVAGAPVSASREW